MWLVDGGREVKNGAKTRKRKKREKKGSEKNAKRVNGRAEIKTIKKGKKKTETYHVVL